MKLRNKKTGEIVDLVEGYLTDHAGEKIVLSPESIGDKEYMYNSLAELNEEWEDYEEPEEYWYITDIGCVGLETDGKQVETRKACGNYFRTKEEAEKAVEKLKAWKRLRDKGFIFEGWAGGCKKIDYTIKPIDEEGDCLPHFLDNETCKDLDLLFGGEE